MKTAAQTEHAENSRNFPKAKLNALQIHHADQSKYSQRNCKQKEANKFSIQKWWAHKKFRKALKIWEAKVKIKLKMD